MDILPVYGLRYSVTWLFICCLFLIFITLLTNYQVVESWVYRNDKLSARQQDILISLLSPLSHVRLDAPFLRWREQWRDSSWLWQRYAESPVPHPLKSRYKAGSQPLFHYTEQQPLQVLLVGDSLAESIQLSLSPLLSNIPSVKLKAEGLVSTTLTNKHFVDWPRKLRQLLAYRHYDLVLVFIGANSCQAVRNDDGSVVSYGSGTWNQAYGARIRDFIQIIKGRGAAVWWLMNPPMLKKDYQACMQSVGRVQRQVAGEMADEVIETADIVAADDGSYTQSKIIGGKLYSLRNRDGVHFTIQGSRLISEDILHRIHQRYRILQKTV